MPTPRLVGHVAQAIDLPDFRAWYNYAMAHKAQTFFALGMVLGLLSLVTPWYAIDMNTNGRHNPVRDFTLTAYVDHWADGHYEVYPLDTSACRCATVASAFNGVFLIAVVGAIIGAGTVFAHFRGKIKGDLTVLLIALTGLMFIGAPLVLASSLTGAFATDNFDQNFPANADDTWGKSFIGYNVTAASTIAWGPSSGFYLSAAGGVFMLLCVYQIRMPKRPAMAASPAPGAAIAYSQMTPVQPPAPAPTPMPPPRL